MYLLFKRVSDQQRGPIEIKGRFLHMDVGYIPDTHVDVIPYDHLNPTIIDDDDVAMGWAFTGSWNGKLSVRGETLQNDMLNVTSSMEGVADSKVKITLTADQIANGLAFLKIALKKMTDDVYDRRLEKITEGRFEMSTWDRQKQEAENPSQPRPLLTALAAVRGITVDQMATLVDNAVTAYNTEVQTLLVNKQTTEKAIRDCTSISDCWVVLHDRFEMNMPAALQEDLDHTSSPTLNV